MSLTKILTSKGLIPKPYYDFEIVDGKILVETKEKALRIQNILKDHGVTASIAKEGNQILLYT